MWASAYLKYRVEHELVWRAGGKKIFVLVYKQHQGKLL
jgi:hypothetical protein